MNDKKRGKRRLRRSLWTEGTDAREGREWCFV
jgi:hypothetical protein